MNVLMRHLRQAGRSVLIVLPILRREHFTLAWKVAREVKEVLPLGRKGTGAPVSAQVGPLHTKPPAYGCLLPHLTGFTQSLIA